mmetsp:Transcript_8671/g.27766  ORF Transcript_8671/g.27766 Transcript_8671/m.27766 type:complete len:297 (-) Transcript_8671:327-1217(-)
MSLVHALLAVPHARVARCAANAVRRMSCRASAATTTCSSLVQADWLHGHLSDEDLIILDATQRLDREQNTASPDAEAFLACRIPGAKYVDVGGRLSEPGLRNARGDLLHNMRPAAGALAAELASLLGVRAEAVHLVLYSSRHVMWATRLWWLLHSSGFPGRVSILDGGVQAWRARGYATESGPPPAEPEGREGPPSGGPSPRLRWRDGAFVGKEAVLRSVGNADVALIDSLKPESYSGARPSRYGRRGHIASAVNVPYARVVDPASGLFLGPREIRSAFVAAGLRPNEDARRWLLY